MADDGRPRPHPRPRPGPRPGPEPKHQPRRVPSAPAEAGEEVRAKISALPGTLTFHDLIRKNKRDSVLLIALMLLLGAALGAAVGALVLPAVVGAGQTGAGVVERYADVAQQDPMAADLEGMAAESFGAPLKLFGLDTGVYSDVGRSLLLGGLGAGIALVIGGLGATWSWFAGSNAILRMVHARQVTPESDRELFNVVDEMRIAAGLPMPKIYLIPETAMNAFATGRDPEHGVVAITTGLREKLTRDELQGVMAHELAHIRHLDIRFALLMATMVGLIVVACDVMLRMAWHGGMASAGRHSRSDRRSGGALLIVLLIVSLVLAVVAPLLAKLIQMAYSRRREYLADAGAAELTRNPAGLASALAKLDADREPVIETANRGTAHMFIVNPILKRAHRARSGGSLFSSHPPTADRIARLLALTR